jgi:hypothetical protein
MDVEKELPMNIRRSAPHGPIHGKLLVWTGVIHTLLGGFLFASEWKGILRAGVFDALSHRVAPSSFAFVRPELELAFWFTIAGPALIFGGLLLHRVERLEAQIPRGAALLLLGIAVIGASLEPLSGFSVLLLPQALFMVLRRGPRTGPSSPPMISATQAPAP